MRAVPVLLLALLAACSSMTPEGTTTSGDNGSSGVAGGSSSTDETTSSSARPRSSSRPVDMQPQGTISGHVRAPSGTFGVFDALVSMEFTSNGATIRRSTHTRFDGSFTLFNIPAGSYQLKATRGLYTGTGMATMQNEGDEVMGIEIRMASAGVRFEVVDGSFDDIGTIVTGLGFSPRSISGTVGTDWLIDVTDTDTIENSHAILLNCGLDDEIWDMTDLETRRQALREYVHGGKSLYISDWAYNVMEWLFPEALGFYGEDSSHDDAKRGEEETVLADIPDETLRKLVGEAIEITYDLPYWAIIESVDAPADGDLRVDVIARATVHAQGHQPVEDVPLAVIVHYGAGRVIYTTFHNEAQLDATVAAVLRYMIMSL